VHRAVKTISPLLNGLVVGCRTFDVLAVEIGAETNAIGAKNYGIGLV